MSENNIPATVGKKQYPEVSAALKRETITRLSIAQQQLIKKHPDKIDLSDVDAVQAVANDYIESCAENSTCPSFMGLCGCLGVSRKWAYEYCRLHPNAPTTALFDRLRASWAALRMALAEAGAISEATAIFLLKNSGHGLTDRQEIVLEPQKMNPLSDLDDETARRRIIESLPPPDNDENYYDLGDG